VAKLVLVHGDDFYSRLIRWDTFSWYSHAAFELEDGRQLGALSQGVVIAPPNPKTIVHRFDVKGLNMDAAFQAALSQQGKPYDWGAIIGLAIRRDWRDNGQWFCSELVAWACEQAGLVLLRTDHLNRITPGELAMSPFLQKIE
jgi:uncharacterized protein YycO